MTTKAKPREGTLAWARAEVRKVYGCGAEVQARRIAFGSSDWGFSAAAFKPGEISAAKWITEKPTKAAALRALVAAVKEAAK